ncbi:hypothetical protein [Desertihabitans aurantiacus]|uniref:hypothetical protein n=1 Tax=Desertihabitans aurantiacus TaxID=2282477 RepID=UPI000DF7541E|nr:hypothetical protein [Desertihabitans aurantiacus]
MLAGLVVGQHGASSGAGPAPVGPGATSPEQGSDDRPGTEQPTPQSVPLGPAEEPGPGPDLTELEAAAEEEPTPPAGSDDLDEVTTAPDEPDPAEQAEQLDEAVERHERDQDEAVEAASLDELAEAEEPATDPDVPGDLEGEALEQQEQLAAELEDVLPE